METLGKVLHNDDLRFWIPVDPIKTCSTGEIAGAAGRRKPCYQNIHISIGMEQRITISSCPEKNFELNLD